jgi:hypothetical protein
VKFRIFTRGRLQATLAVSSREGRAAYPEEPTPVFLSPSITNTPFLERCHRSLLILTFPMTDAFTSSGRQAAKLHLPNHFAMGGVLFLINLFKIQSN